MCCPYILNSYLVYSHHMFSLWTVIVHLMVHFRLRITIITALLRDTGTRPPQARREFVPTPCRTQSCPDTSGRGTSKICFGRTRDRTGHDLFWKFGHDETRSRVRHKFVSGRVQGTTRVQARPNLVQKRLRIWLHPLVIVHLET